MFKPEPKGLYWWIDDQCTTRLAIYHTDYKALEHERRVALGNCFEHRTAAVEAAKKLREFFKELQEDAA